MQSTRLPGIGGTNPSDDELIQTALMGNRSGYEQLVWRYQDRLFRSIFVNVGYADLAEDITQEAFVQAYLHLGTFENRSGFYTWLFRIALNLRRKHLRHRHLTLSIDAESNPRNHALLQPESSPPERLERSEEQKQVRCALARLDDVHREILILREFEGFTYHEIAELMQIKQGTVRSRLHRARTQLRKELSGYVLGQSHSIQVPTEQRYHRRF
tara:strand:- start:20251 stop:20892 length:642 start_codon:yes stop_codon:yes gene_type:complete